MGLNVIKALVKIANALDAKGLFDEASIIDNIVRSAIFGLGKDKDKGKSEKELIGPMRNLNKVTKDKDKMQLALDTIKTIHEEILKFYNKYMETGDRKYNVKMHGGAYPLTEFENLWKQHDLANIAKGSAYESEIKAMQQTILYLFKDCHKMYTTAAQKETDKELQPMRDKFKQEQKIKEEERRKKEVTDFLRRRDYRPEPSRENPNQETWDRLIADKNMLHQLRREKRINEEHFYREMENIDHDLEILRKRMHGII